MSSDGMIRFEEDNWDDLAEKFIEKHRALYECFVMEEYENNMPEPPDYLAEEHGKER